MPVLGIFFAKNKNKFNMQLLKKLAKTYYGKGMAGLDKKRVLRQDGGI
jgi:hypothetical protein